MATPVLEGVAITTETSNATSSTVTLPASVAADDIIVIMCSLDGNVSALANSGGISMTEFIDVTRGGNVSLNMIWGRAAGSETSQDVTWSGSQQGVIYAMRISGCHTGADVIDVIGAQADGVTTTLTPTSPASVDDGVLFISTVAVDRDVVDGADTVSGTGWSEAGTSQSSGGANGAGIIAGELDQTTQGTPADAVFGTWSSDQCVAITFGLASIEIPSGLLHQPQNVSLMI